ncbi:carboxylesterase/lipase family protein [Paenibacillus sp. B01]|uniref:carboxylesterase/lipase family protein n=1 Tax=Paenibacillus sp. B01 TaxID=2660554 RepID=UPI00129B8BB8|nr:carboxylesterase/lipase family protein [Paenibacillus sp. B01]QGG54617.1 carboxylesterase family protein [Paenibacillus sp. B01]
MDSLHIRSRSGTLQGIRANGTRAWKGIPFAQPPVGDRRFRRPLPPQPWAGVRDASQPGPLAPQPIDPTGGSFGIPRTGIPQSEDCLYLNVWAPEEPSAEPLPVMVWIHGGSFVTGGGGLPVYDGASLARRGGLIVVSISYRLGALGFLHLGPHADESDPDGYVSNAGLLDQIAALQWVQADIGAFGGDPSRVTVFGESAGAMSIAALLAMPAAKGLFARAILQSGASQALPDKQGRVLAQAYLDMLGAQSPEQLAGLTAEELQQAADRLKRAAGESAIMLFQPVVDGRTLPAPPVEAVAAGSAAGVDLIVGINRHEGALFVRPGMKLLSDEQNARAYVAVTGAPEAAGWVLDYPRTTEGQQQAMTDLFFLRSALQLAEAQLRYGRVWFYRYDFVSPGHPVLQTAFHAAEVPFVLGNLELLREHGWTIDERMERVSAAAMDAWLAFARSGSPATAELDWPAYEAERRAVMLLDADSRVALDPEPDKWARLTGRS